MDFQVTHGKSARAINSHQSLRVGPSATLTAAETTAMSVRAPDRMIADQTVRLLG
jgi:hypothetical protein